jgi:hypothetical protein
MLVHRTCVSVAVGSKEIRAPLKKINMNAQQDNPSDSLSISYPQF